MKASHDLTKTCNVCLVSPAEPGRTTCYACKLARAARARATAGLPPLDQVPEPTADELAAIEGGDAPLVPMTHEHLFELVDLALGWSRLTSAQQALVRVVCALPADEMVVVAGVADRLVARTARVFDDLRESGK